MSDLSIGASRRALPLPLLLLLASLVLLLLLAAGCDDDEDDEGGIVVPDDGCQGVVFNGFVETDEFGNILSGGDLGQWCLVDTDPITAPGFGPAVTNPFCALTQIEYAVPAPAHVRLRIYDEDCNLVQTLLDMDHPEGLWRVDWNRRDNAGSALPEGYYAAVIEIDDWKCWGILNVLCAPGESLEVR